MLKRNEKVRTIAELRTEIREIYSKTPIVPDANALYLSQDKTTNC